MRNYIVCLLCVICSASYSQTPKNITIKDLSSKNQTVITVKEDLQSDKIYLINQTQNNDSITITEAREVDTVIVRLNSFLEVVYRIQGGSGEHLRATKILSVNNGRIIESLSLLTLEKSYSTDGVLQENYTVKINLEYRNAVYTANLVETVNGVIKKNCLLPFDKKAHVFSGKKNYNKVSIYGNNEAIKGYYQVALSENDYIYYQGSWYQQGRKGYIKM